MIIIYCYDPTLKYFDIFRGNSLWGYYRTRSCMDPRLTLTDSVWIVPGTVGA